ncbi:hypothetical protein NL108_002788 [Boleophthalmus pectinirostris]|nr:hypothetical protein NL108_002788 [Boleophthalmus pectinirostris]
MVLICVAMGCSSWRQSAKVSFYQIPTDKDRRQRWIADIKTEGWR